MSKTSNQKPLSQSFLYAFGIQSRLAGHNQLVADCPLCVREDHFYAKKDEFLWDCKLCGETGNAITFLRKFYDEFTSVEFIDLQKLADERGLPIEELQEAGLRINPNNDDWLIPIRNQSGEIMNLIRWKPKGNPMGLPSLSMCLIGLDKLIEEGAVYLVEGPWDLIACRAMLTEQNGKASVLAVPGANTFKTDWVQLFKGRDVVLLYDNDQAGLKGMDKVQNALFGIASSIQRIEWAADCSKGYDIRDAIKDYEHPWEAIHSFLIDAEQDCHKKLEMPAKVSESIGLQMLSMDDVESLEIEWTWKKRVPKHGITLIAGEGGYGKSFIAFDIAARISTGTEFPDQTESVMGDVGVFAAEDDPSRIIKPRLQALEADCSRIHVFDVVRTKKEDEFLQLSEHLPQLRKWLDKMGNDGKPVSLLIFDPINSFLGKVSTRSDAEVRKVLGPLTKIAQEFDLAIICICHTGKSKEHSARNRVLDSVAFVNASRSAWMVGKLHDEDSTTYFLQTKQNYGKCSGLAFEIKEVDGAPKVFWKEGEVHIDPNEIGRSSPPLWRRVLDWVKKHKGKVSSRKLQQAKMPGIETAEDARQALKELEKRGYGTIQKNGKEWTFKLNQDSSTETTSKVEGQGLEGTKETNGVSSSIGNSKKRSFADACREFKSRHL